MIAIFIRVVLGLIGAILVALVLVLLPAPVIAHAQLEGSNPPVDALLDVMPEEVTLRFSEPVGVTAATWIAPDGQRSPATASAVPGGLVLSAPPDAGRGTYVLDWRVVSADGHPVGGALVFSVGEITGAAAPEVKARVIPAIVTRYLAVLSVILAVGAAVYAAVIAPLPPAAARLGHAAAMAALPLGLLALGAYGLDLLGRGPLALLSWAPWSGALQTPRGWAFVIGAAASLIASRALQRHVTIAVLALALAVLSLAMSGHASAGPNRWIGQPLMALHAAALIFWIGSLPPLIADVSRGDGLRSLRRFSGVALPAVLVLAASGVGLTVIRSTDIATVIASSWGQLLALKLVLVAGMLGLALLNKTRLTPALITAPGMARTRLRRSIGAEVMLGAAVLLVAMCFRLTPPPNAMPAAAPISLHLLNDRIMVDADLSMSPPGAIDISLGFRDKSGRPFQPQEVKLAFNDPAAGIGPIRAEARAASGGVWLAGPMTFPSKGPWDMAIKVLITDFEQSTITGTLRASDKRH